jgi:hypothetical protein
MGQLFRLAALLGRLPFMALGAYGGAVVTSRLLRDNGHYRGWLNPWLLEVPHTGPGGSDWACLNAFTGWGRRLRFEHGIQIAFVENSQKWQGAVHSDCPRKQLCPLASGNALTNSGFRNDRRGMRAVHRLHHQVVR